MSRLWIPALCCVMVNACAASPEPALGRAVAHNLAVHAAAPAAASPAPAGERLAAALEVYATGAAEDLETASTSDVFEDAP